MALATLSTAWCSYHSAAWTRKSNRLMNEFNSLERRAGLQTMQGMQQATIHTAMFMEFLAAKHDGNEKLANFYVERFPPDVRKAYDAWMAQKPFENPKADPHPFVPCVLVAWIGEGPDACDGAKRCKFRLPPTKERPCKAKVGVARHARKRPHPAKATNARAAIQSHYEGLSLIIEVMRRRDYL